MRTLPRTWLRRCPTCSKVGCSKMGRSLIHWGIGRKQIHVNGRMNSLGTEAKAVATGKAKGKVAKSKAKAKAKATAGKRKA